MTDIAKARGRLQAVGAALAIAFVLLLGGWWLVPRSHAATEYSVDCPADGNGSESDLADAITAANASAGQDTIVIGPSGAICVFSMATAAGDYGTGKVALPLITDPLTIRADGLGAILERAGSATESFRVLESQANLTLENITVRGGETAAPWAGGGIYAHQGVTLTNVILTDNVSYEGGGGIWMEGNLTATTIAVTGNTAARDEGGGIYVGGSAIITGATFSENVSAEDGGGLYVSGTITLSNSTFYSNTANGVGGGVLLDEGGTGSTIVNSHFERNHAGQGGGLVSWQSVIVDNSEFEHNGAQGGGALIIGALDALVTNSRFISNTAYYAGAALIVSGTVQHCLFESNTATGEGDPSPINGAGGGLIAVEVTVERSRFVNNTALSGGGLFILHIPPFGNVSLIINNLWLDNDANTGAAIYVGFTGDTAEKGHAEIKHNTIVRQTLSSGSALQLAEGTANIYNNIITQHTIGISAGSATSVIADYNLFYENTIPYAGVSPGANDLTSDPLFVDSATADYHLLTGSPAIDSGQDGLGVSEDLDGVARPQGGGFDRGAYEAVTIVEEPLTTIYLPVLVKP